MMELVPISEARSLRYYDEACRALAKAKATDEVKEIRNRTEAMRAYARQSKNVELEADAFVIRSRAERRIGELMAEQKAGLGLNKGTAGKGRPKIGGVQNTPPNNEPPTLEQAGIDKNLAKRARNLAGMPEEAF